MTFDDVLTTSRQELALYRELWAVYERLAAGLSAEVLDTAVITGEGGRAAAVTAALRDLAATLAPHRLVPAQMHATVTAVWRESAVLAAAAADANRRAQQAARAQQRRVGMELGRMGTRAAAHQQYQRALA